MNKKQIVGIFVMLLISIMPIVAAEQAAVNTSLTAKATSTDTVGISAKNVIVMPKLKVNLNKEFKMQPGQKATLQDTEFTIELEGISGLTVCSTGTEDKPEVSGCRTFWEAKMTAQNKDLTVESAANEIGKTFALRTGEETEVFGYVVRFQESDGETGVFIIKKTPVSSVQIVELGHAFEMQEQGQKIMVKGTGLTIALEKLGPSKVCVKAPCNSYPEARIVVTNKDIYADRAAPSVAAELTIKIGENKEVFGYIVRFEKSDGKTGVFIIDKKIIVTPEPGGSQIVELGHAFEMQEEQRVAIQDTRLTIDLLSIEEIKACTSGAQDCYSQWEAKLKVTNGNIVNDAVDTNENAALVTTRIAKGVIEVTMADGTNKNIFGYALSFAKTDGKTAVFIVDKVSNPIIQFRSTSEGYTIKIESHIYSPTKKSEGQETEMDVKSITFTPGDMSIRVKTKDSSEIKEIYANLEQGIEIPTAKEGQNKKVLIKSDYSNLELALQDKNVIATTRAEVVSKESGLYVKSSDGRELEVKVLPSVAAERAREVLGEKFDRIELKDGGKLSYEVSGEFEGKVLGFIPVNMKHTAFIDAESGAIVKTEKPWYNFLVTSQN